MATARKVVATSTFVAITDGRSRVVVEGTELPADDPVVKANPTMFTKATTK
jgi:hypothetical protein